jgi:hypothetical protein
VNAADNDEAFPVAFGGAVYITGLERSRSFYAETTNGVCRFQLPAADPAAQPALPETYRCLPGG